MRRIDSVSHQWAHFRITRGELGQPLHSTELVGQCGRICYPGICRARMYGLFVYARGCEIEIGVGGEEGYKVGIAGQSVFLETARNGGGRELVLDESSQ